MKTSFFRVPSSFASPATPSLRAAPRGRAPCVSIRASTLTPTQAVAPVAPVALVAPVASVAPGSLSTAPTCDRTSVVAHATAVTDVMAAPVPMDQLVLEGGLLEAAVMTAAMPAMPANVAPEAPSNSDSAALEFAVRLLAAPYHAYSGALKKSPLLTKACTSLVGFMLGDLIAQHVGSSHHESMDVLRVLRLGAYGLCLDGPLGSMWYDWLEANVNPTNPTSTSSVLIKTALDQVVYASFGTALFFATITTLEGHPGAVPDVVAAKFFPTLAANYTIWPIAHMVNFRWVPSQYRLLYNNVVSIGWLALLSVIAHSHSGSLMTGVSHTLHGMMHHH